MTTFREEIYPVFLPGQILSSGRLNEIIRYLDGENRVTRTDLSGIGIACGLQSEWVGAAVHIKPGFGVSSDGYLLNLPCLENGGDHIYNKLEPFTDESGDSIFNYRDVNQDLQQIPLFRLRKNADSGNLISTKFNPSNPEAVVMLYLSVIELDSDACGMGCDDQGKTVQTELIPLIIHKGDLLNAQADLGFAEESILEHGQLSPLAGKRLQLDGEDDLSLVAAQSPEALKKSYDILFDSVNNDLADEILNISQKYADLLGLSAAQKQLRLLAVGVGTGRLRTMNLGDDYQYGYSFIQDLIAAYREFYDLAYYLAPNCCPDYDRHPRHLMISEFPQHEEGLIRNYRSFFRASPALDQPEKERLTALMLYMKIIHSILAYQSPSRTDVAIYPDAGPSARASLRSLPFYYKISPQSGAVHKLLRYWNPDFGLRGKHPFNLAHPAQVSPLNYGVASISAQVAEPLKYSPVSQGFLRIAGHQGHDISRALPEIKKIRAENNLPFKLAALSVRNYAPAGALSSIPGLWVLQIEHLADIEGLRASLLQVQDFFLNDRGECWEVLASSPLLATWLPLLNNWHQNTPGVEQLVQIIFGGSSSAGYLNLMMDRLPTTIEDFMDAEKFEDFMNYWRSVVWFVQMMRQRLLQIHYILTRLRLMRNSGSGLADTSVRLAAALDQLTELENLAAPGRIFARHYLLRAMSTGVLNNGTLSGYAASKPGLEHFGGVERGGTFFLVYDPDEKGPDAEEKASFTGKVIADFALPSCCDKESLDWLDTESVDIPPLAFSILVTVSPGEKVVIPLFRNLPTGQGKVDISLKAQPSVGSVNPDYVPKSKRERLHSVEFSAVGLPPEYQVTTFQVDFAYSGTNSISGSIPVTVMIKPKCKPFIYAQDLIISTVVGESVTLNVPHEAHFVTQFPTATLATTGSGPNTGVNTGTNPNTGVNTGVNSGYTSYNPTPNDTRDPVLPPKNPYTVVDNTKEQPTKEPTTRDTKTTVNSGTEYKEEKMNPGADTTTKSSKVDLTTKDDSLVDDIKTPIGGDDDTVKTPVARLQIVNQPVTGTITTEEKSTHTNLSFKPADNATAGVDYATYLLTDPDTGATAIGSITVLINPCCADEGPVADPPQAPDLTLTIYTDFLTSRDSVSGKVNLPPGTEIDSTGFSYANVGRGTALIDPSDNSRIIYLFTTNGPNSWNNLGYMPIDPETPIHTEQFFYTIKDTTTNLTGTGKVTVIWKRSTIKPVKPIDFYWTVLTTDLPTETKSQYTYAISPYVPQSHYVKSDGFNNPSAGFGAPFTDKYGKTLGYRMEVDKWRSIDWSGVPDGGLVHQITFGYTLEDSETQEKGTGMVTLELRKPATGGNGTTPLDTVVIRYVGEKIPEALALQEVVDTIPLGYGIDKFTEINESFGLARASGKNRNVVEYLFNSGAWNKKADPNAPAGEVVQFQEFSYHIVPLTLGETKKTGTGDPIENETMRIPQGKSGIVRVEHIMPGGIIVKGQEVSKSEEIRNEPEDPKGGDTTTKTTSGKTSSKTSG